MTDTDPELVLHSALDQAARAGADAADVVLFRSVSQSVTWRLGALEDIERSEGVDLGVRLMFGKRAASVSGTDLSPASVASLIERCAFMAKAAPEDEFVGLAPQHLLARAPYADLDLGDFGDPGSQALKARAAECEAAALAVHGVTNSSGASASYGEGRRWFATSDGFFGASGGSHHAISVSVIAADAQGMERDYDYDSKTHASDLRAAGAIGVRAGERAVERLSPRRLKSRSAPVIFDNRVSSSILSHLAGAANGAAIARGVSFLKDKMRARIFPEAISIADDPFIKRGHGSRPFDGEGVAASAFWLIEAGVLTQWFLNAAQARQLKLETNGRATRGASGAPGSGPTNLTLGPGAETPDAMLKRIGECLLVTDMFGPQINPNTGDYSVGCSGFWCEGGARAYPVSEITIAGSLLEMFSACEPANDLERRGAINAPSLFLGAMTIAGD